MTTVTRDHWSVGYTSGTGIKGVILKVSKHYDLHDKETGFNFKIRYGMHNNKQFASQEAANAFALERGYLQVHYRRRWCSACMKVHSYLKRNCPNRFKH